MRPRGGGLGAGIAPAAKSATTRLRCAPHVCSGRQHSGSAPIQTLGHAPFAPELQIVILTPAAPELK
eukprot:6997743-Prymnesium_polylepis.1